MSEEILVLDDMGRLQLADAVIAYLESCDDPRAPEALAHYRAQRDELAARIRAANEGAATVITCQPGRLGIEKAR